MLNSSDHSGDTPCERSVFHRSHVLGETWAWKANFSFPVLGIFHRAGEIDRKLLRNMDLQSGFTMALTKLRNRVKGHYFLAGKNLFL
jgi:hypothetical protein